ncbi:MAG: 2TM domain-containing protein [Lutibacter sp.]
METTTQHEIYEKARHRVKQKKRLYTHFVIFLIGSVLLIVINKFLHVGESFIEDWFVWAILIWLFLLLIHTFNVWVLNRFFNKDWERTQTEKLIAKHQNKVEKLEKKIAKKFPTTAEQDEDEIVL